MEPEQDEQQIATWLEKAGLAPDAPVKDQLGILWRALRHRDRQLSVFTRDLDAKHSQHTGEMARVACLQKEVEQLKSILQEQQQAKQKMVTVQNEMQQATEQAKSQRNQTCSDLQTDLSAQSKCLQAMKTTLELLQKASAGKAAGQQQEKQQLQTVQTQTDQTDSLAQGYWHNHKEVHAQDDCETVEEEICETLKCLDKERSKCHEIEQSMTKLYRANRRLEDELQWRDGKIKDLERELALCIYSLEKKKNIIANITVQNETLQFEKGLLLQQLIEEEHVMSDCSLAASSYKHGVDLLEEENQRLLYMSRQHNNKTQP